MEGDANAIMKRKCLRCMFPFAIVLSPIQGRFTLVLQSGIKTSVACLLFNKIYMNDNGVLLK